MVHVTIRVKAQDKQGRKIHIFTFNYISRLSCGEMISTSASESEGTPLKLAAAGWLLSGWKEAVALMLLQALPLLLELPSLHTPFPRRMCLVEAIFRVAMLHNHSPDGRSSPLSSRCHGRVLSSGPVVDMGLCATVVAVTALPLVHADLSAPVA